MRGLAKILLAAAAMAASVSASATSVFISAASNTPTYIGMLTASQIYSFTVTGVASLCAGCNNGGPLNFTADGKPIGTLSAGYAPFAPNGLDYDPTGSGYGQAGPGFLIGALLLTASPSGGGYVASGLGGTVGAPITTAFYGIVNDSAYNDNIGATGYTFDFDLVTSGGVPEPATWTLMLGGFGAVGLSARRRSRRAVLA